MERGGSKGPPRSISGAGCPSGARGPTPGRQGGGRSCGMPRGCGRGWRRSACPVRRSAVHALVRVDLVLDRPQVAGRPSTRGGGGGGFESKRWTPGRVRLRRTDRSSGTAPVPSAEAIPVAHPASPSARSEADSLRRYVPIERPEIGLPRCDRAGLALAAPTMYSTAAQAHLRSRQWSSSELPGRTTHPRLFPYIQYIEGQIIEGV